MFLVVNETDSQWLNRIVFARVEVWLHVCGRLFMMKNSSEVQICNCFRLSVTKLLSTIYWTTQKHIISQAKQKKGSWANRDHTQEGGCNGDSVIVGENIIDVILKGGSFQGRYLPKYIFPWNMSAQKINL